MKEFLYKFQERIFLRGFPCKKKSSGILCKMNPKNQNGKKGTNIKKKERKEIEKKGRSRKERKKRKERKTERRQKDRKKEWKVEGREGKGKGREKKI